MTKLQYQTDVYAPADRPYVYYPNPDNIQEWPPDIVKESEDTPNPNNEEHSDMIY